MKIKFTNFRSLVAAQYEIPDTGLVLLSGASGAGKSTVIKGILWALFGSDAVKKPCTFGATSCSVILDLNNLHIVRTNKPNRLVVNNIHEDAAGEEFIRRQLCMSYDDFCVSSYIPQKNNSSILSLAPTEQLRLIKTISFHGEPIIGYKESLLSMVKESMDSLKAIQSEHEFIKKELTHINTECAHTIESPLNEPIDIYHSRVNAFPKELKKLELQKAEIQNALQTFIKSVELQSQIEALETRINSSPPDDGKRRAFLSEQIKLYTNKIGCDTLREQIETVHAEEERERIAKLERIRNALWSETMENTQNDALAELQACIKQWEAYTRYVDSLKKCGCTADSVAEWSYTKKTAVQALSTEIQELKTTFVNLEKDYEMYKLRESLLTCPKCDCSLVLSDTGMLSIVESDTALQNVCKKDYNSDIKKCRTSIACKEKELRVIEDQLLRIESIECVMAPSMTQSTAKKSLEELRARIDENTTRKRDIVTLSTPSESAAVRTLKSKLDAREKTCVGLVIDDLQAAQKELQALESNASALADMETTLEKLADALESLTLKTEYTEADLQECEVRIKSLQHIHFADIQIAQAVAEWEAYTRRIAEVERWTRTLRENEQKLKTAECTHTANLVLKDKYNQAEIVAVDETIDSINEHTRYYLDTFFTEHELSVQLVPTRSGGSLKIDTTINYKGHVYDGISQLSGGEFDRCTLASICGINSMLGSNILLLDESLAALDAETNTEILTFLKNISSDKLVLVCSHEAVTGIFDTIINIGN